MASFFGIPVWKVAYHIYSKTMKKNESNKQYLEPLSTLFKLALVSFKDSGTKIAITNHRIYVQSPSFLQGTIRSVYGNTREEIHHLLQPILQCVKLYPPTQNQELAYLYKLAIKGLRRLKKSYDNDSSTVCYTIDLYISILDRTLLSKSIYIDSYSSSTTAMRNQSHSISPLFEDDLEDQVVAEAGQQVASQQTENAPLEAIWRQIWTKDEIHLIYNLFHLTEQATTSNTLQTDINHNRQGYLSSIEDLLRAKEEVIDESIHRANLWI